jgi:acetylornithine deacetylase/succinyl-diaminopimelate desuccinylase-like protein
MEIDASLIARVLDLAVTIQQVPAPPFGEEQRAAFIRDRFQVEGLKDVAMDEMGNVFGCLPGKGKQRPLVVSAHLDTVFPFDTDLQVRREADKIFGPGIGDNSLGLAGLFGLLWALRQEQGDEEALAGDIWFVANVGEEGLGDLRGMRAVVDRFGEQALAYLILEGMALGQVYHRALGVQRYRIVARTAGGHSWVDYGRPSAIHELAKVVTELIAIPVPSRPRSSLNVGVISGGTSVNSIASEAHLELDLRSEGTSALANLVRQVEQIVKSAGKPGVKMSLELIGRRPAGKLASTHPLVRLAKRALQKRGIRPNLTIGSTDANLPLSRGLPALTIGLSTGFGAHTANEYIHTQPVMQGLEQLVEVVEAAFGEMES